MTISYPRNDIMASVEFDSGTKPLQLVSRQELSRLASGKTIGKDFGPALWFGDFTTVPLTPYDSLAFEAKLNSLDGVIQTFEAGDMRAAAQYPRNYPDGNFLDSGVLNSVNGNNKAISIGGLAPGFQLSVGAYLAFDYGDNRALHQIMEDVNADESGITPEFEVRPFIRPGFSLSSPVTLKNPRGIFVLMPGSVALKMNDSQSSVVSFQAVQSLS